MDLIWVAFIEVGHAQAYEEVKHVAAAAVQLAIRTVMYRRYSL